MVVVIRVRTVVLVDVTAVHRVQEDVQAVQLVLVVLEVALVALAVVVDV